MGVAQITREQCEKFVTSYCYYLSFLKIPTCQRLHCERAATPLFFIRINDAARRIPVGINRACAPYHAAKRSWDTHMHCWNPPRYLPQEDVRKPYFAGVALNFMRR